MLRQLGRAAVLDLLNSINDDIVVKLERHFGERIVLRRLNYDIVRNVKIPLDNAQQICNDLCLVQNLNYFTTWRDANFLYICLWG